jgi:hypothetical protein
MGKARGLSANLCTCKICAHAKDLGISLLGIEEQRAAVCLIKTY